jgi:hypothetical protein
MTRETRHLCLNVSRGGAENLSGTTHHGDNRCAGDGAAAALPQNTAPTETLMLTEDAEHTMPASGMPLLAAADLQDHLMVASNDLERLQRLLDDASEVLMGHFTGATQQIDSGAWREARSTIGGAITALQFQDMASQLIAHTSKRLRNCADRLARDTFADDDDEGETLVEEAPLRPNPVTQDEMDAGSIELF